MILGKYCIRMHPQHLVQRLAAKAGFIGGIDKLHHDWNTGQFSDGIGRCQDAVARSHIAFFKLDRLGA